MTEAAIQTITKERVKRPGTDEREAAVRMLRAEGAKTEAIAEALGLTTGSVYQIEHRIRKNGNIPLLSPKRVKTATSAIDAFMKGEAVGEVRPKCSTVLSAAQVVLDRAYPKQVEQNQQVGPSFTQINISLAAPHEPRTVHAQVIDCIEPA